MKKLALGVFLVVAGCTNPPDGCFPATWDEHRGCVETGQDGGVKERITIPECCGYAKGDR